MHSRPQLILLAAIAFGTLPAQASDPWTQFYRDAKVICPSHHLEWLPDIWANFPDEFEHTLPPTLRHRVTAIENFGPCSKEKIGFDCEGSVSLSAYQRVGILKRFTRYTCRRFVCTEGSICPGK